MAEVRSWVSAGTAVALQPSIIEIPLRGCRLARFRSPLFVVQCPRGIQTHPYGASGRLPFTFHCPPSIPFHARFPLSPVRPPKLSGGRGQGSAGEGAAGAPDAQRATDNGGEGVRGRGSGVRRTRVRPPLAVRQTPSVVLSSAVVREEPCPRRFRLFTVQCSPGIALFSIHPPAAVAFLPPLDHHADGRSQR